MNRPASNSWTLVHHRELEIIEVRYRGSVTAEELLEGVAARIELAARESVTDFLLDGTQSVADRATAEVVYDIVTREYPTRHIDPRSRFAFLPPDSADAVWLVDFFEAMCAQHDLASRRFSNRDAAIEWLTSGRPSSAA